MTHPLSDHVKDRQKTGKIISSLLFLLVLAAGAYFRFNGILWGESMYLHPDERFLVWVGTDISPVQSLTEYFDTPNSSLNPHNRGHGFYVYGTLPMFLTRYAVEGIYGHSGFDEMTAVGRGLSALADLLTVLLVFLVAERLYNRRVAVLAAAFSAASVLQIQQSHFFTMDTFVTMFTFLAFACAAWILKAKPQHEPAADDLQDADDPNDEETAPSQTNAGNIVREFVSDPLFLPSLLFGISLGMAVASKLNAAAVAVALPAALVLYILKQPPDDRRNRVARALIYLFMAAFVSLLVFRLFQPYAFSGPGLFGLKPNPQWVSNIQEQRAQSTGDVDFPPAMQWARRPMTFSFQNMVLWGFGLPLGILAWSGFLWVGWRLLSRWKRRNREWFSHALIWGWTAIYFAWQSIQLNPTMRYELPIYPTLAILAGWTIVALYDRCKRESRSLEPDSQMPPRQRPNWAKIGAALVSIIVLAATYAYAYGFSQIYSRPITRIAASHWIYQNIPGPITLPIRTANGQTNQILSFPYENRIQPQLPYTISFEPRAAGILSQIILPQVVDESTMAGERTLEIGISNPGNTLTPLATGSATVDLTRSTELDGKSVVIDLEPPIALDPAQQYLLTISLPANRSVSELDPAASLVIEPYSNTAGPITQEIRLKSTELQAGVPLVISFRSGSDGLLTQINLVGAPGTEGEQAPEPLGISLQPGDPASDPIFSTVSLVENSADRIYSIELTDAIPLNKDENYTLSLSTEPRGGMIALFGTAVANEGDWDDGLPLRMDGYDGYGGIYPTDLSFNMYTDDNPEKLERFLRILDQAEYLTISSNRQWGTLPRIPERFPMTTVYYRNLLGCPEGEDIVDCYRVAVPGRYTGSLGFELVQVFTSEPSIGPFKLNDQFAEEAFSVYDHPKVLIFKKTAGYSSQKTAEILGSVDFSKIIRKPPLRYSNHPEDLTLPKERWEAQQAGGTWSELYNTQSLINRSQPLSAFVWYVCVMLLGLVFYPLLRLALPGLDDHGYPLARITGMLSLSYLVWLAGSFGIPFTRLTISIAFGLLALAGVTLAFRQRSELKEEWRTRRQYFMIVEGLALAFFIAFLLVRFGNPDLWHPWKGGEKPMELSYFNAVLKSTTFPPFDPWYAGGYLNYYYYGYVLVGVLVKWLGIVPAVAYNLILPTLFSLMALGAFSLAWNLSQKAAARRSNREDEASSQLSPYIPALSASLGMAVLGNLGIVKMIYQGFQRLAAPGASIEDASLFTRLGWAFQGLLKTFEGAKLPYGIGDWYWNPSRIIPAPGDIEPITEFPFFSLLYADLHAHLMALSLTLLALAVIVGIILGRARWREKLGGVLWFLIAGLAIGALRPTNTWDFPTYLAFGLVGTFYAIWRAYPTDASVKYSNNRFTVERAARLDWWYAIPAGLRRLFAAVGGAGLLAILSLLLFQPFAHWYALGYTQIDLWNGTHTPLNAYLNHWIVFLWVIVAWMTWETRDWLAKTPVSALRTLKQNRYLIEFLLILLFAAVILLTLWREVAIAWLVLPLATWAGILTLRPDQPDAKRIVLFITGTGLILTLMVEVIVLHGDIGRMNTVFKFYLQVWTVFAISAAACLSWLLPALRDWHPGWRGFWQAGLTLFVAGVSLYPIMATTAKIKDRMAADAPHTLDGMAYMKYATYTDEWGEMDLSQDYRAIRWMQENVTGSPVIVEANLRDLYRWGSRYTINTGLPGVAGWEWHQQQQRVNVPGAWITERILEIEAFYLTTDLEEAQEFLEKYDVQYIIVGQQERGKYPGRGLEKFDLANGTLWSAVYREGETVIYKVKGASE